MARTADYFAVYIIFDGGIKEEVRFRTLAEFQKWYSGVLIPKHDSKEFINVPIKNVQDEYMVVRPANIIAIRVEPIYNSSIDMGDE
ncbi:MAG: hypothetical protein ACRC2J_16740 [Microcoleaceae cyanobacterium]|jgi:hypothetical protein